MPIATLSRLRRPLAISVAGLVAALLAACGSGQSSGTSEASAAKSDGAAAQVPAPSSIASAGKIVFCSDISYPPMEFRQGDQPVGADVDLGTEIARRMGVTADFQQTGFDAVIASVLTGKCDAIASGMTITPQRREQLGFVPYLRAGQAVIVRKGNPAHINGLDDLSGKSVAVQVGTTNKDYLDKTVNPRLTSRGKAPIKVVAYPQNTDAVNALRTDQVDAYFADGPPVAYLVKQQPANFQLAGPQVGVGEFGIAVKKENTGLQHAMQRAMDLMYKDGTVKRILVKWGLGGTVLEGRP